MIIEDEYEEDDYDDLDGGDGFEWDGNEEHDEFEWTTLDYRDLRRRGSTKVGGKHCQSNHMQGAQFNDIIRKFTDYHQSEYTRSLLNDTDTTTVAACSTNWYSVKNGGISTVTCDEYNELNCHTNEDLGFTTNDEECLEPSSSPSASPSATPSASPSAEPSYEPSISSAPSFEPTYSPTFVPTYTPTEE